MLHMDHYGPDQDRPLLIVHGLFGSARNWGVIAKRMGATRRVVAVDMRNHGTSPRAPSHTYPDMAADLAEVIDHLGGSVDLLGHSMGGKAAMTLALTWPDKIAKLIVADIAPVAYGHTQMPLIEAMRDLDLAGLDRRSEADARLSAKIDDPMVRSFLLQSLDLKAAPPAWRLNLDVLAQDMDAIIGWPALTGSFEGPTLFVTGAASDYVDQSHRDTIRSLFPRARFAKISGAGHWLHAEKPREFAATIEVFLDT